VQALANAIIVLWGWRRYAAALAAGAVSAAAFAPFSFFAVLWLTVPVLVWLIDGAEAREGAGFIRRLMPAAAVGWTFGFGFFVAGLWWIGVAFLVEADQFAVLMPLAVIGLPAVLAVFWGLAAAVARAFWLEGGARILVFALAFAVAEWLRGHLLTGFPWNAFGYALTPVPLMMQSAALVGLWGLTLAAFFIFAAPAVLGHGKRLGRADLAMLGSAAALLVLHLAFGAVRLAAGDDPTVAGVRLRIVQPAIPQDERWEPSIGDETMARYVSLSRGANPPGGGDYSLLIWPESAFPFVLTERPSALAAIADLLGEGTTLVTGAVRADRGDGTGEAFNSVFVIDDAGEIRAAYDKVHLVPFGEYLPFRQFFDALGIRQLVAIPRGFTAGARQRTLALEGAPSFAPLICYEVIFPGAVVPPENRPGWLLNVTNDEWYGDTAGPYQHILQARLRAVEEGLPLVRAANSGISAIIDPHGRITASLPLGQAGVVDGNLPVALAPTLYGLFGDLVFVAMLLAAGISAVLAKIYLSFE
jgi:apolipoprotein N-acyltransferase